MSSNATAQPMRRLRAGIVGGGRGAFIGPVHRIASSGGLERQARQVQYRGSERVEEQPTSARREAMRPSRRVDLICLLSCSLLLSLPAISGAQQLPPAAKQMAKTFGLDSFGQVEAIRYTFAIAGLVPPRTWEWHPKTDTVTYEGKDKEGNPTKVTYKRSEIDSQSDVVKNQIDPGFVNDQYWLLLPLHVAWDGATVTDEGMHETPLGKTQAQRIAVKYAAS